jgi:hypothetical protein
MIYLVGPMTGLDKISRFCPSIRLEQTDIVYRGSIATVKTDCPSGDIAALVKCEYHVSSSFYGWRFRLTPPAALPNALPPNGRA